MSMSGKNEILSPVQRQIVGYAFTCMAVAAVVVFFVAIFFVLRNFVLTFSQVLWPLVVAAILATLLKPLASWLQARLQLSRNQSIILMYVVVSATALGLGTLLVMVVDSQVIAFFKELPDTISGLGDWAQAQFPQLNEIISKYLGETDLKTLVENLAGSVQDALSGSITALQQSGAQIMEFVGFVTAAAIVPVYLFFLLQTDRDFANDMDEELGFLPDGIREDSVFLTKEFTGILISFFRGQLLISLIMGVCYAAGFWVAGLKFGLLLGMAIGLLNIIPYLGTILGFVMILPIAWLQQSGGFFFESGGVGLLLSCLAVFGAVQVLEGYYLTPNIMNKQTGLHPMLIIVAIFFWGTALNGILGMILAIPLTAFFVILWRLLRKKYLPMLMGKQSDTSASASTE